jgi:hypothetical protein
VQPVAFGLQVPWSHNMSDEQAVVHAPQWAASALVSVHTPLHNACPAWQPHAPSTQPWPAAHALPQAPQLLLSVLTTRHWPLHAVRPAGQSN